MPAEHMRPEGLSQGYSCTNCGGISNMVGTGHIGKNFVYVCIPNPNLVAEIARLNATYLAEKKHGSAHPLYKPPTMEEISSSVTKAKTADRGIVIHPAGYHLSNIKKGELGELSKIQEELDELKDAVKQGSKIMALVELSDLYGALILYIEKHHPGTDMEDIISMSSITRRAFTNGHRK